MGVCATVLLVLAQDTWANQNFDMIHAHCSNLRITLLAIVVLVCVAKSRTSYMYRLRCATVCWWHILLYLRIPSHVYQRGAKRMFELVEKALV